jgi:hypothetical protein
MNREEAQDILRIQHPQAPSPGDAELAAARELVRHDPELADWWEQQRAFDGAMRQALAGIPVPAGLAERIVRDHSRRLRVHWWHRPIIWAAAASVALLAGVWHVRHSREDEFAAFSIRMARAALRDYRMEIQTNDLAAIRGYLASRSAPADYQLRARLDQLPGLGCGIVRWRNQPVSMICLDRGQKQILWLFVADPKTVPGAPTGAEPAYRQVGGLAVAVWNDGHRLYLAGALGSPEGLRQYL